MASHFRIHPAIGVARVGNAPDAHFIGPEHPGIPANWGTGSSFRDEQGRIKRQVARFRVYEYTEDSQGHLSSPKEVVVGNDVRAIEWRVHLANKKASFFTFNGQSGADDVYIGRDARPSADPEKQDPPRTNRRNASDAGSDRQGLLEIDPGEKVISTGSVTPDLVVLTNPNTNIPIPHLGQLRLDEVGRLVVFGGLGTSVSTQKPPVEITEYANNDTWFDDMGDGPVRALIHLKDDSVVEADAAWVLIGPPDFAPGLGNVVSLYDTLWDIAVRELPEPSGNALFGEEPLLHLIAQQKAWKATSAQSLVGYSPSFTREIYPLLARAFAVRHVFDPGEMNSAFHGQLIEWERLATPDSGGTQDAGRIARQAIFRKMRDPGSAQVNWAGMPRGLGDDYDALSDGHPKPTSFLSLTRIQYAVLQQWANGQFISDWPDAEPNIPAPSDATPDGLDRAALENCVGGPFFPGIEVSWLIRRPELYSEPFRLKVPPLRIGALDFGPGFFTQQMAMPWQADFYDCRKEHFEDPATNTRYTYMWWTAQRPDDVFPAGATERVRWVRKFDAAKTTENPDAEENLARFKQMQEKWAELRFVIQTNGRFEEEQQ